MHVLVNLAKYAVERRSLVENSITALSRQATKVAQAVDALQQRPVDRTHVNSPLSRADLRSD
jgi:phage shock protein A